MTFEIVSFHSQQLQNLLICINKNQRYMYKLTKETRKKKETPLKIIQVKWIKTLVRMRKNGRWLIREENIKKSRT